MGSIDHIHKHIEQKYVANIIIEKLRAALE